MKKIRRRLTFANVVSCIALFVALGGASYAAIKLPKNSVGGKQIKKNAVNSSKVKNHSLKAVDFKAGQLPAGKEGPEGPRGPEGPFPGTLGSGITIRGTYDVGGTAAATGALATGSISFGFQFSSAPEVHYLGASDPSTSECPGDVAEPAAAPGNLCVYSQGTLNTAGLGFNFPVHPFGEQVYLNSSSSGEFWDDGTWAATSP